MGYMIYYRYTHQPWSISTLRGTGTDGSTYYGESIDKYPFDAMCRSSSQGLPTYITKACWDSLSDSHKNIARARVQGIVTTTGHPTPETIIECFRDPCRMLQSGQIDPAGWKCEVTYGAGYRCTSSSPDAVAISKQPGGPGSVRASRQISVPSAGGKIEFGYSANLQSWAPGSYIKIDGDNIIGFSGNGSRSSYSYSGAKTIDMGKYAGRTVAFEVVSTDTSTYSRSYDHTFGLSIKDFKYTSADPCADVVCEPECVGTDRYATVCKDGTCIRGGLVEANSAKCGYVTPECTPGDKKPGEICNIEGKWVPHTPGEPVPGAGRLYVKFDVPYMDMLPGIPYEPWMWIPPGFKIVEE